MASTINSIYIPAEELKDLNKIMHGVSVKIHTVRSKKTKTIATEGIKPKDGTAKDLAKGGLAQEYNIENIVITEEKVRFPILQEALGIASNTARNDDERLRVQELVASLVGRIKHYETTKEVKIFGKKGTMGDLLNRDRPHGAKYVYGGE